MRKMRIFSLEKACTKCSVTLPLSHYYRARSNRDGHHNSCKSCMNKQSKEHQRQRASDEYARNRDRKNFNMLFNLWKQLSGPEKEEALHYLKLQVRKHLD